MTDAELEIKGAVQPSAAAGAVRPSCDSSWGNICRRASHGRCVAAPGPAVGEVPCAVPRPRTRTLCRRRRPRGLWRGFHDEEVALEMKAPRTRFADEELEHGQGKVKGTHSMGEERQAIAFGPVAPHFTHLQFAALCVQTRGGENTSCSCRSSLWSRNGANRRLVTGRAGEVSFGVVGSLLSSIKPPRRRRIMA